MEYNYFGKEQKVLMEELDNGLKVYVLPNKNASNYFASFVTRYGGDIKEFLPLGEEKYAQIPEGLAHFLEHKVFDMEKEDAFTYFARYGTYCNASTSNNVTKYLISGKKGFKKCLNYLTTMVFTPFFTDETVNKEMDIITEEIKMYYDEPEWQLENEFRQCFFNEFFQEEIAGTPESIRTITKEKLWQVYRTFYQPSNMFLVVSGNIKMKDVLEILNNNLSLKKADSFQKISYHEGKETKKVDLAYKKVYGNIVYPKLKYGFKFDLHDFSIANHDKLEAYLKAIFSILFNEASTFNEHNLKQQLSNWYYIMQGIVKDDIYVFTITGESEDANHLIEEVNKVLDNIQITREDFERIKKVWYSLGIRSIDKSSYLAEIIIDKLIIKNKIMDQHQLIEELDFDELTEVVQQLNFKNNTFVLMLPNDSNLDDLKS